MKATRDEIKESELDQLERQWEMQFYELQKFKKKYGHCDVSRNSPYYTLARWCNTQRLRRKYMPLKYAPDRLKKLNELGFCWGIKDRWFESKFRQLKQYSEKYGDCDVDGAKNAVLAKWCTTLRRAYKKKANTLTKERIKRLNEIGFPWDSPKEQENEMRWERQFERLQEYRKKYGHCNVSLSEGGVKCKPLADWVKAQRGHYHTKNKCLSPGKIKRLNAIGLKWVSPLKLGAKRIKDTDLLTELRRLHTVRNTPPSCTIVDKYGKYSAFSYIRHFGSMAKARKAAGIKQAKISRKVYSDDELLNELKRVGALLGRTPTHTELLKYGKYSPKLYEKRFGGLKKARKKASMSSSIVYAKKYSDAEMLDELRRLYTLRGKPPGGRYLNKYGKYSRGTYYQHFGSLPKARKAAGIP